MNNAPFLAHRDRIMSELNTINEAREMLTALLERKDLQVFNPDRGWITRVPAFHHDMPDFKHFKYRVKPEPLVFWVNVYKGAATIYSEEKTARDMLSTSMSTLSRTIKVVEVIDG